MNNKISVIVPIYNSSKTLNRTLNSIINQTYSNLEIILINDGSVDDSIKICKSYQKKDSRIIVINQENKGVGEARNKGIEISTGDYISFVDSDDTLDDNFFEELMKTMILDKADVVESGAKVYLQNSITIYPYEKKSKINYFNNKEYIENYLLFKLNVSVWGKIYKKSIIGDTRFPSLNINEDFIFLWEIVKKVNNFVENLNINYHYYLDKDISLSKAPFNAKNMTMIRNIKKVKSDVEKIYPDLEYAAKNYYDACLLHNLILYYNYLNSNNVNNLYQCEYKIMLDEVKNMKKIKSYLLLHEADYDIDTLILSINKLLQNNYRGE